MQRIAYYVTAHGYGHGVRSTDILNALYKECPALEILVVTELPDWFLKSRLKFEPHTIRPKAFDVGMVQLDSVQVDLKATAERLNTLLTDWDGLLQQEQAWLLQEGVTTVVSDIPGIPLQAAHQLGIKGYAVGNFSWDWIYEEFSEAGSPWIEVIQKFKEAYAKTTKLFQLPFACPMESFPNVEVVPLVSLPGLDQRQALSEQMGIPLDTQWILLSFTTLELVESARQKISALSGYSFLTIKPLDWDEPNFYAVDPSAWAVPDLFATVDVVLTKPGYGVLSDCAVNDKPIVYVERTDFRETPYLIAALEKHFCQYHLLADKLYAGDVEDALKRVMSQRKSDVPVDADGGAQLAKALLG